MAAADAVVVVAIEEEEAADAEGKRTVDEEKTNEIKNTHHDFLENFTGRFCDL